MNLIKRIFLSALVVVIYLIVDISVRITGGDFAGGIHYQPHTWTEIEAVLPRLITISILAFLGTMVYLTLSKRKDVICPSCEHSSICYKELSDCKCPKCGNLMESAKEFYKRHPEWK